MRSIRVVLHVGVLVSLSNLAGAAPFTLPPGLFPGDHFRIAFVADAMRNGNSSNIDDYNSLVSNAANAVPELAALGTTWKAIAGTDSISPQDNTGTNPASGAGVPVYRIDGAFIAANNIDLWDGSIANPINVTESGGVAGVTVWTYDLGSMFPKTAQSFETGPHWIYNESQLFPGTQIHPVYGMSGILTVPIPEPGGIALALFALAGLSGVARRLRAKERVDRISQ